jgi:hypothetical protein
MIITAAHRTSRAGFSLLETSIAISISLVLAVTLVVMLQQHLSFMAVAQRQSFLADEAPKIGNLLGRILNQTDSYFVYENRDSALAGASPVLSNGEAVRLFFKSAAQQTVERMITVEDAGDGTALRFYATQPDGTQTAWTICDRLQGASFRADEGILNMTLVGPNGEEITYCGGAR